ncbi:MAG: serine/threonine-protein kinase, partial [Gemmataceae bacterium]
LDQCGDCRQQGTALCGDDFLNRLRRPTTLNNLPPELAEHPQYQILRELGRGGMGVVYLAKNKLMDRLEVLKVINKELLDTPGSMERFLREIRSAAKLNHPNVVAAYSALQMGELLVFAMEYVDGENLAQVVKARGPLPVVNVCHYVQQAAIGLQHAFEKGMVHRDIKPQNLILAREGKKHIVKVLDFGLAKATQEQDLDAGPNGVGQRAGVRVTRLAELTGAGQMLGTPGYVAPEQTLDAAQADIRADIYSLGCTLYYLLTGQPPYRGRNLTEILQAHQTTEARPLNLVRADVPEELAAVVRRMMAKEPAKRYQTPAEVVQALSAAVKSSAKGLAPKSSPPVPAHAAKGRSEEEKRLLRAETILLSPEAAQATILGPNAPPLSRNQSVPVGRSWLRRPDVVVAALL